MSELRNLPTQKRSRETLDSLIEAADELFAERGVGDATNSMIAERAGVSIGTLYRFFPNKSALVAEYLDRYMLDLASGIPDLPAAPTLEDLERIVAELVDRTVRTRMNFRGYGRVRLWRYPETGEMAVATIRDAEFSLIHGLIAASPYEISAKEVDRMSRVIIDAPWPIIEGILDSSPKQRALMQAEIVRLIASYIRAVIEQL